MSDRLKDDLVRVLRKWSDRGMTPDQAVAQLLGAAWSIVSNAPVEDRDLAMTHTIRMNQEGKEEVEKIWKKESH